MQYHSQTINSISHTFTTGYDSASRVNALTYPSGFAVKYGYITYGYQTQLTDAVTGLAYWTANARDAELHLTQQTAGNTVVTSQTFDPNTGLLTGITAGVPERSRAFPIPTIPSARC